MCYAQVANMGTGAIALSLPFSCVLGLLASMTSSTMGKLANNLNRKDYYVKTYLIYNNTVQCNTEYNE